MEAPTRRQFEAAAGRPAHFVEAPEAYHLRRIEWQLLGTFTFKSDRLPERVRKSMYFAWLRGLGRRVQVKFPDLLWCLRQEAGEIGGRLHFHHLVAGLPESVLCSSFTFELMSAWQKLGGGWARVVIYQHYRDGVGYVVKRLGYPSAAEESFSGMFGSRLDDLTLSNSVRRVLHRANLGSHRTQRTQTIR